jgi:hypothetical protein
VFAAHLNGDGQQLATITQFWQQHTKLPTIVAVQVVIASDRQQALALADTLETWQLVLNNGQRVNLGSEQQAYIFAEQAGSEIVSLERKYPTLIAGSGEEVFNTLQKLHQSYGIDEFIIDLPISDPTHRRQALTRLAASQQATRRTHQAELTTGATL